MRMKNYKITALLPMKANSERVKGKNFRDFCGKPLFRWMLDTLMSMDEIDQVVINTDAYEILFDANVLDCDRLTIRKRRPEICGDHVSMNLILADDVENINSDIYLMTHTTNPLLSAATIRRALAAFEKKKRTGNADSLFTVNRVQKRFYRHDCSPVNHDPSILLPTQQLEPWFEENSSLYLFTAESFSETKGRIGKRPMMFETSPIETIDIDTEADWRLAVAAASALHEK